MLRPWPYGSMQCHRTASFRFHHTPTKNQKRFLKTNITNNSLHVGCTTWSNSAESLVYRLRRTEFLYFHGISRDGAGKAPRLASLLRSRRKGGFNRPRPVGSPASARRATEPHVFLQLFLGFRASAEQPIRQISLDAVRWVESCNRTSTFRTVAVEPFECPSWFSVVQDLSRHSNFAYLSNVQPVGWTEKRAAGCVCL